MSAGGKMTLHKLVVLGDGGVGKTALTIQVYIPTHTPYIESVLTCYSSV